MAAARSSASSPWSTTRSSTRCRAGARRFAEGYTDDERLLATIEQHDRPYNLWRKARRRGRLDEAAFGQMIDSIPDLDLFLRFVELDGSTEGKSHEPIRWLEAELGRRELFDAGG